MPSTFIAYDFDTLFAKLVKGINETPDFVCSPRGQTIKENLSSVIELKNPRARLIANPARDANYGFAVGEFMWYWLGRQDLESMIYYNKRMNNFSDDGFTLNSAYGYRTRVEEFETNTKKLTQWESAKHTLIADKDSRRAVMVIARPKDFVNAAVDGSKDVPCTLTLQFFIRDGKLHLHVNMRSNDAFWGLTYDLFSFTLLQECMMLELGDVYPNLQLGSYTHCAASLHIYDRHFKQAEELVKIYETPGFHRAASMSPISLTELAVLADDEALLRTGKAEQIDERKYSGGVRWMAEQLNLHRRKRDVERGRTVGSGDCSRIVSVT